MDEAKPAGVMWENAQPVVSGGESVSHASPVVAEAGRTIQSASRSTPRPPNYSPTDATPIGTRAYDEARPATSTTGGDGTPGLLLDATSQEPKGKPKRKVTVTIEFRVRLQLIFLQDKDAGQPDDYAPVGGSTDAPQPPPGHEGFHATGSSRDDPQRHKDLEDKAKKEAGVKDGAQIRIYSIVDRYWGPDGLLIICTLLVQVFVTSEAQLPDAKKLLGAGQNFGLKPGGTAAGMDIGTTVLYVGEAKALPPPKRRKEIWAKLAKGSLRNKCVLCTESADAPDPARSEEESTPLRVADDERRRWAGRGGPRMQQVIS